MRISGDDPDCLEVMVGLAVPDDVPATKELCEYFIPAGRKLICYWLGASDKMESVYIEMQDMAQSLGLSIQEGVFEYPLNSPEYTMQALLTKVVMILQ